MGFKSVIGLVFGLPALLIAVVALGAGAHAFANQNACGGIAGVGIGLFVLAYALKLLAPAVETLDRPRTGGGAVRGHASASRSSSEDEYPQAFHSKLAGVTMDGKGKRQGAVSRCFVGQELGLARDPENPADPNAISVWSGNEHLGYLRAPVAAMLAPLIDGGRRYRCRVSSLTGGAKRTHSLGVNVFLWDADACPHYN